MEIKKMSKAADRTFRLIHLAYIILILCITYYIIIENLSNSKNILFISIFVLVFVLIAALRHTIFKENKFIRFISPYIELCIVIPLAFPTQSAVSLWFILMLNIDVIIDYKTKYGVIFSIVGYITYIICYLTKLNPTSIPHGAMVALIGGVQYTFIMSVGFIAKKFYEQNNRYKQLMAKQKAQMLELEQMTVLKERNRMAGEIHDTVGHQLTTALVQLEATSVIIDNDKEQAKRRLSIIKEQVKTSLNELRSSIRQLKDENYDDLSEILTDMFKKVKVTTGIDIHTDLLSIDDIPENARKTIHRMIMEAITNAIKHGRCKNIWLVLRFEDGHISIKIENDGFIPEEINYGFGLNRMKERVEELDGMFMHGIGKHGLFVSADILTNRGSV